MSVSPQTGHRATQHALVSPPDDSPHSGCTVMICVNHSDSITVICIINTAKYFTQNVSQLTYFFVFSPLCFFSFCIFPVLCIFFVSFSRRKSLSGPGFMSCRPHPLSQYDYVMCNNKTKHAHFSIRRSCLPFSESYSPSFQANKKIMLANIIQPQTSYAANVNRDFQIVSVCISVSGN